MQKLLILLVNSVLLCLNCFYDFVLGLCIIWSPVTVTRNVRGIVVLSPFHLSHMHPSLGLWLDFDGRSGHLIDVSGATYHRSVALSSRRMSLKLLKSSHTLENLVPGHNENPSFDGNIKRRAHF